ncbi:uncharacterized protein CMU_022640 [Cryptosporidium muris RN66]|uniref:Uncharacterized protein n=1 Tax=Cryptosporidium muris (strain RN66) TaxID=441375 RepID=B6ABQ6_CRYMR|nr:uncharacterized protein CMU_022640 [Cryptosporidium muris RN66]EEA05259.1 hypothetical protein CMU_022640 [Cryptosporidium muris RN66]|eukprot:XP_002139608.1 hypothetical protein [Cryptosporidium muris RN66]
MNLYILFVIIQFYTLTYRSRNTNISNLESFIGIKIKCDYLNPNERINELLDKIEYLEVNSKLLEMELRQLEQTLEGQLLEEVVADLYSVHLSEQISTIKGKMVECSGKLEKLRSELDSLLIEQTGGQEQSQNSHHRNEPVEHDENEDFFG